MKSLRGGGDGGVPAAEGCFLLFPGLCVGEAASALARPERIDRRAETTDRSAKTDGRPAEVPNRGGEPGRAVFFSGTSIFVSNSKRTWPVGSDESTWLLALEPSMSFFFE